MYSEIFQTMKTLLPMKRILCIDDDPDICLLLSRYLGKNGYEVETAFNGSNGLNKIVSGKFDLVLCDFRLPDKAGLEMIQAIKDIKPDLPIIIITGYSDVKIAVKAIKYGAFEYVIKPIHPEEILLTIKNAIESKPIISQSDETNIDKDASIEKSNVNNTPKEHKKSATFAIKGSSPSANKLYQLVSLVAPTDMTVLILGESGTGKEVMAKTIHEQSKRKGKPFVAVDCGALPKELAASELFGHKKGSFTGAIGDKIGHFEAANGGTLFLDEIGNLSYENQIKLLRVLQERKVKKIGDTKDLDVDVRIIVATNEDLKKGVVAGTFREDILFRINEFQIDLPSLRERKGDLSDFASHFLNVSNEELGKDILSYSDEVLEKFKLYHWPGNLREMKNVVKRAALLSNGKNIELKDLPQEIVTPSYFQELESEEDSAFTDLKSVAENAEKKAILAVLARTGYNKSKTAEILKVDRKTLYNKITAYGISLNS